MAVNEEMQRVIWWLRTPTNGAAGVITAVILLCGKHEDATQEQVRDFLLVAVQSAD